MSQANLEVVRQFADRWARSDWDAVDEAEQLIDPNVELHGTVGGVEEGRVTTGLTEMKSEYDAVEEMWDEHRVEIQELLEAGDRVVLLHREHIRGKSSGVEMVLDAAVLFDLRDGRITRIQGYMDRDAALQAAGLES
jgi:ketosteroid isomerase-like protein